MFVEKLLYRGSWQLFLLPQPVYLSFLLQQVEAVPGIEHATSELVGRPCLPVGHQICVLADTPVRSSGMESDAWPLKSPHFSPSRLRTLSESSRSPSPSADFRALALRKMYLKRHHSSSVADAHRRKHHGQDLDGKPLWCTLCRKSSVNEGHLRLSRTSSRLISHHSSSSEEWFDTEDADNSKHKD